jgi:hypothetical protein
MTHRLFGALFVVPKSLARLLLLMVLSIPSALLYADDNGAALGSAYALDGTTLLYTEAHHWRGVLHTVEYFRPSGELVAVNELDSSASFISPAYTQHYPRTDFAEGARWHGTELVLFSGAKQQVVHYQVPLVISSGFYHFILEHWQELHAGRALVFDFAVPSRMTTVRLRMHALGAAAGGIKDADPSWFYVRVEAANALLRWLVQPLTVAFDDQQRLMVYRGIANVRDEHGDTPQVLIRYRYPEHALTSSAPVVQPTRPTAGAAPAL